MATPLTDAQARFHDYVINDGPAPLDITRSTSNATAEKLLGIYHTGYRLSLLEALEDDYQALRALLGDEVFETLGREYIAQTPSKHYSIRWYGRGMAAYLSDVAPWQNHPELAQLAAWEWALGEAADAADEDTVGVDTFGQIPPEDWAGLVFRFHPSLRRLDLTWSVPPFRQAVQDEDDDIPALEQQDEPVAWAIWRQETQVYFRSLADGEEGVLEAALGGATFGALCEALTENLGDDAAAVAGFLRSWVEHGWITAIKT
ncbi:MAG: putative DNA-binding domain-containing protein [Rhodospirillales bacterium]|nr:putative DNA-binding domain-containing protein [Alphaproteobacteria bacterium]MBL6948538.1 putative DNA-binding domain-containing protein [Rhodospirillales bacterium]